MKTTALLGIVVVLLLEAGCLMGPKYKRPGVDVPQEYRAPAPQEASQASSLGNEQWWKVYQDPALTQLIHTAIAQNYDVRIAAARVLEAQAQVGITRANQLPSASVGAETFSEQNAKVTNLFPAYQVNGGELNLSKVSSANGSGPLPIARDRMGSASGNFVASRQCSHSLFPASRTRQRT